MSSTPEPPRTRLFLSLLLLASWFIPRLALFLLSDDCHGDYSRRLPRPACPEGGTALLFLLTARKFLSQAASKPVLTSHWPNVT